MKVSTTWLKRFFETELPSPENLADVLTFHSSEIEELERHEDDTVLDVKVLPDKSAWMLSHRGVAKELSVALDIPMADDPLLLSADLSPRTDTVTVTRQAEACDRYAGVVIEGVKVGPSPAWLQALLKAIGQRSINNVVDATNFVMFNIGQPLHAFDIDKLSGDQKRIGVRMARDGETITTLTGEEYALTTEDMLIVDGVSDAPIGIAGVKGGKVAEVDEKTVNIFVESAHFDRTTVRLSSQRLKLRTDASQRFENGVVPQMAAYGPLEVARLIGEIAGGTVVGYVDDSEQFPSPQSVSVTVEKINSVLGLSLSPADVEAVVKRFGYAYTLADGSVTVTPPFERDDLTVAEDLVEEIGRMYGLEHIASVSLAPLPLEEHNTRFYYAEKIRRTLVGLGFSEIYTSSFRAKDTVKLENALASDKQYLRSSLHENIKEALERNIFNKDLLGVDAIKIFEVGTVFPSKEQEQYVCAIGVRHHEAYKAKKDDPVLQEMKGAISDVLGTEPNWTEEEGIVSINIDTLVKELPSAVAHDKVERTADVSYRPFSLYPFVARDIALWTPSGTSAEMVEDVIKKEGGEMLVRHTLFDVFEKDGRTSYAFRLVFQSYEKTLTDPEVNEVMDRITSAAGACGWEVR